jgi:dTDP-4-amino-4,6-dideoxygalactose transaminase
VAVPAYSFIATANVVEAVGAEVVFVDIEEETFSLDPGRLRDAAAAGPLAAVIPVHPFGQLARMAEIADAAGDVPLVEDAAAALGATGGGRPAGAHGLMGCFSFHPRKAVTTGEGGAVSTDDPALARTIRALRNHGQDPDSERVEFVEAGLNYRMTEFQAALGITQIRKLERIVDGRRTAAGRYDDLLVGSPVRPPVRRGNGEPVFQSYVTLLPSGVDRDSIIGRLRAEGIETQIGTWHMPLASYYRTRYGYRPGDFPVTDAVFARSLTLPLHPLITAEEQARVVERLLAAL